MAELDLCIKNLLKDKAKFADVYNAELFGGRQVLRAEGLTPVSEESGIVIVDRDGMKRTIQRKRDIAMMAAFGTLFILTGIEGQGEIHLAMPVRGMVYDALDYAEQVIRMEQRHTEGGDRLKGSEFLSGITKDDRLIPVITLTLYYGREPWSGPLSLYDMMGFCTGNSDIGELRKYLPDYRINVVDMRRTENLFNYKTSLQHIFSMVKYNSDKKKLYDYAKIHRQELRSMDADSITAMLTLLGEQKRLMEILRGEDRKEEQDMCKAIDDLIADGEMRGEELGRKKAEARMAQLFKTLLENDRQDLLMKATEDEDFRQRLFLEYHLN